MPSELYVGGGVYMPIGGAVDYWPVAGVTVPQHYWPFSQTGDYTDQGSTGGLNLSAGGTGNSFNSNGLVMNGNGWASVAGHSDLCDLGSTFSLLIDTYTHTGSSGDMLLVQHESSPPIVCSYKVSYIDYDYINYSIYDGGWSNVYSTDNAIPEGQPSQIVLTYTGGRIYFYVNGSPNTDVAIGAPIANNDKPFQVNAIEWGNRMVGTITRVGVLKGTAWSADDVAAIYTGLS